MHESLLLSSQDDEFYERLLVRLLATAADTPRALPEPETLEQFRVMWRDLQTIASIVNVAEAAIDQPGLTEFSSFPPHKAVVLDLVERAAETEPGYRWLSRALHAEGVGVADVVSQFRSLVHPKPYASSMSRFHHDRAEYRWVLLDTVPLPHNPYKLPAAEKDRFDRAFSTDSAGDRWRTLLGLDRRVAARREARVRRWWDELTAERLRGWPYVDVRWEEILHEVHRIHSETAPWSEMQVESEIQQLPEGLQRHVRSLLFSPITWDPASSRVSDGQHRCLAMKAQGVRSVLVAGPLPG
jgi:hypothetical protein